jgi:hypothetical protein
MIDFQSSATALRPCPSGTFDNSQQHARVIYGWVHRPLSAPSPTGTAGICVHRLAAPKPSEGGWFKHFRSRFPKAIQGYSSLSKPIQGFFGKMILYFLPRRSFSEGGLGWHRGPGRDGELTPAAKLTQKQTK